MALQFSELYKIMVNKATFSGFSFSWIRPCAQG